MFVLIARSDCAFVLFLCGGCFIAAANIEQAQTIASHIMYKQTGALAGGLVLVILIIVYFVIDDSKVRAAVSICGIMVIVVLGLSLNFTSSAEVGHLEDDADIHEE